MMTVKEASRLTGISIRTLQYYDKLGLLPAMRTELLIFMNMIQRLRF